MLYVQQRNSVLLDRNVLIGEYFQRLLPSFYAFVRFDVMTMMREISFLFPIRKSVQAPQVEQDLLWLVERSCFE